MLCFLCGKKIGFIRGLLDQQYCCVKHRNEARLVSAQAVRDEDDNESWVLERSRKKGLTPAKPSTSGIGQSATVLAFLAVGGAMLGVFMMGGPRAGAAFPTVSADPGSKNGILQQAGNTFSDLVRGIAPITMKQSFSGGTLSSAAGSLADWTSVAIRASADKIDDPRDWIGKTKTSASLRLWKKSTIMQNYQMEFQAQLEKTSLSWATRATDANNYYATKLSIIKAGPLPNAGLIRYTMVDGKETDRTLIQIPVTLKRNVDYRIRVTVQDDRILTYLNGQFIGRTIDKRLGRGGVGFFDDAADPQKVSWVSVSERDSFLGRMLAHFSLFVIPGEELSY
ncbi:MAG: hypothetical protein ABI811_19315 [Acidobacteriota bacterium]